MGVVSTLMRIAVHVFLWCVTWAAILPASSSARRPQDPAPKPWLMAANWDRVQVGLATGDVRAILGDPDQVFEGVGNATWQYVEGVGPQQRTGTVVFIQGKVVTSSRGGNWSPPAPPTLPLDPSARSGADSPVHSVPPTPDGLPGWFYGDRWNRVKRGASREEVKAWLGEPSEVDAGRNEWIYYVAPGRPSVSRVIWSANEVARTIVDDEVSELAIASLEFPGDLPRWLSPAAWVSLRLGMPADDVRRLLGEPHEVHNQRSGLTWKFLHVLGSANVEALVVFNDPDFPELSRWHALRSWKPVADAKRSLREARMYGPAWASPDYWRRLVWRVEGDKSIQLQHWGRGKDLLEWVPRSLDASYDLSAWKVSWSESKLLGMPIWRATCSASNGAEVSLNALEVSGAAPTVVRNGSVAGTRGFSDEMAGMAPWLRGWYSPSSDVREMLRQLGTPAIEWTRRSTTDFWRCVWTVGGSKVQWVVPFSANGEPPTDFDPLDPNTAVYIEEISVPDSVLATESARPQVVSYNVARSKEAGDPSSHAQRWADISPGDGALWVLYVLGPPASVFTEDNVLVWKWGPWEIDGQRIKSGTIAFFGPAAGCVTEVVSPQPR